MPEHARVFLTDDDPVAFRQAKEILEKGGHEVIESASTFSEAIKKIPQLKRKRIQAAILDGSLDGSGGVEDGQKIADKIKAIDANIVVIGHAARNGIPGVDINCPKIDGLTKLNEVVTQA